MTLHDPITFVSAIAALVAALATLAVVWEMKRQHHASYMPHLMISDIWIRAFWAANSRPALTTPVGPPPSLPEETPASSPDDTFITVPIRNLGAGPATNLTVEWEFDVLDFAAELERADTDDRFRVVYNEPWLEIYDTERRESGFHNLPPQHTYTLPYLLPVHLHADPLLLHIPRGYKHLYELLILLSIRRDLSRLIEPPPLRLTVRYRDLGKSLRYVTYLFEPHTAMMSGPPDENTITHCYEGEFRVQQNR